MSVLLSGKKIVVVMGDKNNLVFDNPWLTSSCRTAMPHNWIHLAIVFTYTCACVHACMHACACVACICAWVRACVSLHAFVRACMRACLHVCMRM